MSELKLNLSGHFNSGLEDLGYIFPGTIQIDAEKPYFNNLVKVTEFLKAQGVKSDSKVTIVLAGMSILASMQMVAIHGLTGQFPNLCTLLRGEGGEFVVGEESVDLTIMRNTVSRTMRENVIKL